MVRNSACNSTESRLGYDIAGELAPAPKVDDEPMATMVSGCLARTFCATRLSD